MQALQQTLKRITEQLRSLPANTRYLVGAMGVILVLVLVLVAQITGRQGMVPLGLTGVSAETRGKVQQHLNAIGVSYTDQAGDFLVPAEQKFAILGRLNENEVITGNDIDYASIVANDNVFRSKYQSRMMERVAKMKALEGMLRAYRDIESAKVILAQPDEQMGIGSANIPLSASVTVKVRSGALTQSMADSIGQLVAGAMAGLKPDAVAITDLGSGRSYQARSRDDFASGDYLEHKSATEKLFTKKLEHALAFVPGVIVSVNAVVDTRHMQTRRESVDEPKVGPVESRSREFTSSSAGSGMEPAIRPNTGASIARSGGSQNSVSESSTVDRTAPVFGGMETVTQDRKGNPIVINAMVGVPRSYFVELYRDNQGDPQAEPDATALDALVQAEVAKIRSLLRPLVDTTGLEDTRPGVVEVAMVHDFALPVMNQAAGIGAPAAGTINGLLATDGLVKNLVLGGLALLSLVMMFLMVRKANNREPLPSAAELVGIPPALHAEEGELIGEAGEAEHPLEAVELDETTLRTQQLLSQINGMVQSEPRDAANILQRWMNGS